MFKLRVAFTIVSILFVLVACQEADFETETNTTLPLNPSDELFTGEDMQGELRTCNDNQDLICSQVFTESDQYALECQRDGNLAVACGCHDWICVDMDEISEKPIRTEIGYNIDGDVESCEPFDYTENGEEVFCTSIFTDEDQFAIDCQEAGHKAVMCGCHKYICVE